MTDDYELESLHRLKEARLKLLCAADWCSDAVATSSSFGEIEFAHIAYDDTVIALSELRQFRIDNGWIPDDNQ